MTKKLENALRQQKKSTESSKFKIFGTLGIPLGGQNLVSVPNRQSYVYVRLRTNQNEVIQAFNNTVSPSYGLPVIVQRAGNRYVVLEVDTVRYANNWSTPAPYLPQHGDSHSFNRVGGGGDIAWIFSQQFMPLLAFPSGSTFASVLISPYVIQDAQGAWRYIGTTGTNLINYIPSGTNAVMSLLYVDRSNGGLGFIINSGSSFSSNLTAIGDVLPYVPTPQNPNQLPIAAIRLTSGTTWGWNNVYDVRPFFPYVPTGTASGGSTGTSGFIVWDEGILKGTATTLNVVSSVADISVSGTVARLFITGSTGGSVNPPVTGTVVLQSQGQTLGSVTTLNLRSNLFANISGTVGELITSGTSTLFASGSIVAQNQGVNLGSVTTLNATTPLFMSVSGSVAQILISGTNSTYMRVGQPTSLSSVTGTYWQVPDQVYATGSLALFNQGHDLIPGIDYAEQYAASGTFQYISTPPTGTYNLVIYGVPATGGGASSNTGGNGSSLLYKSGTRVDVTNDATERTILTYSVPGGTLGTNNALKVIIQARIIQFIASTLTIRFKYGSTTMLTISAIQGVTTVDKSTDLWFLLTANGSTNAQRVSGRADMQDTSGAIYSRWNQEGTATEDSTTSKTLEITVQWNTTSTSVEYDQSWAGIQLLS